jgi:spore coat-associated protein N
MNIKKQLSMGIMSAALGITLIGGGTFAYFSDSVTTDNTFAAGTLNLSAEPTTIIEVDNMKPGDSMIRTFELHNDGSLDIGSVFLDTEYTVDDAEGNNTEDFGAHIEVEFLYNVDKLDEVIYSTTLDELRDMSPEVVGEHVLDPILGDGLPAGDYDDLVVKFNFVDNDEDQNQFQGDALNLEWTFTATQTDGEDL